MLAAEDLAVGRLYLEQEPGHRMRLLRYEGREHHAHRFLVIESGTYYLADPAGEFGARIAREVSVHELAAVRRALSILGAQP